MFLLQAKFFPCEQNHFNWDFFGIPFCSPSALRMWTNIRYVRSGDDQGPWVGLEFHANNSSHCCGTYPWQSSLLFDQSAPLTQLVITSYVTKDSTLSKLSTKPQLEIFPKDCYFQFEKLNQFLTFFFGIRIVFNSIFYPQRFIKYECYNILIVPKHG